MPKRSLTAVGVDRLKAPTKGQVEYFDKGYPGLALRVSYGGGKSWVFFYRFNGRLRRMTLGTYPALSLGEAREAWRTVRAEAARGRDPASQRPREAAANDFNTVSQEWLRRDQATKRSYPAVERIVIKELLPHWGSRRIDEIGPRDILDLIDGIVDRGHVTMARRVQAYVHRLFKWAKGRHIIEVNPAADLPKPGAEVRRDRVLTDNELKSVWLASNQLGWPYGNVVKLLILTGARREEIGQLRWSEVGDDSIRLKGARTKNGEPHDIPLSAEAGAILAAGPRIAGSELAFTSNSRLTSWPRTKERLDEIVKIPAWRIHDLRRTVSTGMNELGVEPHVVEAVLGHTVKGVAGVYNRAKYETAKRAALEAWGEHVMRA